MIDDAGVVLRRRGPLECIDLGFAVLRADAGRHLRVALGPGLVAFALGLAAWWVQPWFGVFVTAVVAPWTTAANTLLAGERLTRTRHPPGPEHPFRAALVLLRSTALPRLGLVALALAPPLAVAVHSRIVFLPEVVLLERSGPRAVGRSERLGARSSSTTVPAAAILAALPVFGGILGEITGQFLATALFQLGTPFGELFAEQPEATPYLLAGMVAVQPLSAMVRLAFYLETRTRAEGLDAYFALWSTLVRA